MSTVYLNGEYIPKEKAFISVDDRGFLFGDGIYEVTAIYRGKMFRWERHLARMQKGLAALRIDFNPAILEEVHNEIIRVNGLESAPISYVYTEITRGVAKRTHKFPPVAPEPTRYLFAGVYTRPPREDWEKCFYDPTPLDLDDVLGYRRKATVWALLHRAIQHGHKSRTLVARVTHYCNEKTKKEG